MESTPPRADEIDLLHVLVRIYRFLVKNWLVVVLTMAISLGLSWVSYNRATRIYESRMVVYSELITESYAIQVINNLQNLVSQANNEVLAVKLHLTPTEATLLKRIAVESPTNEKSGVREEEKRIFVLVVETTDPNILTKLQAGLVNYFEENEFLKARITEKKRGYQQLISQIKSEIDYLDKNPGSDGGSLHPLAPSKTERPPKTTTTVLFEPSTMKVFMGKQLIEFEEKLVALKGLDVIDGFAKYEEPVKPRLAIYMASGFSSGILLSFMFLGMLYFRRIVNRYPD